MNRDLPVDLDNCDKEPIHIPGAIQPHGVLIACDENTFLITHVSDNAGEVFNFKAHEMLGKDFLSVVDSKGHDALNKVLTMNNFREVNPIAISVVSSVGSKEFDAIVHKNKDGKLIFELEPIKNRDSSATGFARTHGLQFQDLKVPKLSDNSIRLPLRRSGHSPGSTA